MKISIIVGFVGVLLLVDICLSEKGSIQELFAKIVEPCLDMLSPENAKFVMEGQKRDNSEIRYYKKCTLKKLGFVDGGRLSLSLFHILRTQIKSAERSEAFRKTVYNCTESTLRNNTNGPDVLVPFYDCISSVRMS